MREYYHPDDLLDLSSEDPVLWREIYGYMQVCLYEDDEADLRFRVATQEELPEIQALGTPEETATITITCQDQTRIIQRIIPDRHRVAHQADLIFDQYSTAPWPRYAWLEQVMLV
ncbi:hypothetical protein [Pelovirga terrestris]|uniref:Uncharacterized protein n=1 Tax=Pelovirga terrestris TaxID=2771352 RepID=A0A8J6QR89_9BACT|nr:hypothetical protein [Pelovirga terrestris]MBD1401891.1 hypothetical protein [Pelovirga terrestris]